MNLRVPQNAGKFSSSCTIGSFSSRAQLHEWVSEWVSEWTLLIAYDDRPGTVSAPVHSKNTNTAHAHCGDIGGKHVKGSAYVMNRGIQCEEDLKPNVGLLFCIDGLSVKA
jgi:hypothetical protein